MKKLISLITGVSFLLSAAAPAAFAAGNGADGETEQVITIQEAEAAGPDALAPEEAESGGSLPEAGSVEQDVEAADTEDAEPEKEENEVLLSQAALNEAEAGSLSGEEGEEEEKDNPLLKKLVVDSSMIISSAYNRNWPAGMVFDGNLGLIKGETNNFIETEERSGDGYVGVDLGANSMQFVKKIRVLPRFEFADRMNGAYFEGSNTSDKTGYEQISDMFTGFVQNNNDYNLEGGPNGWIEVDLSDNVKSYRYLRLTRYLDKAIVNGNRGKTLNVTEMEFYMAAGASLVATKMASQIGTLVVNDGEVGLPSLSDANYDLSYSILRGGEVASLNGNTVTYTASKTNNVEVEIGVAVKSRTDAADASTMSVKVMVERARTAAERVEDDKALTEALDITVYSEDDKEIVYLLPKRSKFQSTLTWNFKEGFENVYGDTITDFNYAYYKLTVDPGANQFLSRTVDVTAAITYGSESDTVDRTISVNPLLTKNVGGHTFHYKQINAEPRGGVEINNEQILLSGYGEDIANAPDTFGYFYKRSSAENMTISVKIDQTSAGTNRYRRFGLMFRSTDDPKARMVMLSISPDGSGDGLRLSSRKGNTYPQAVAYQNNEYRGKRTFGIIKLEKKGSKFRAYYSEDQGVTFTELIDKEKDPNMSVSFDGEYLVGLFAASNNAEPTYFSQLEIDGVDVFASNDISDVKFTAGDKKINVSWTDPTEQDIRTFDKIAVTCTDGKEFTEVKEVEKGIQSAAFENLTNGTEYTVQVRAKTAEIRKNAVPAELTPYHAYSAPISEKVIPFDVNEFRTNRPKVNVAATSATGGRKSNVSLSFEKPLPIYRMALDVAVSDGLMVTLNDITLSDSLTAAGAAVEKTSDGFRISYSAKNGTVINISEIAKFGAGSHTAGSRTVSVGGNIVFYTQETGEVSVSPSEDSKKDIIFSGGSSGPSTSTGGGRGGGGYGGGVKLEGPSPTYTPPADDNKPPEDSRFLDEQDIPSWAKKPVLELARRGIISGSPSENGYIFNPGGSVTREQFIKMCITAFAQVDDSASCDFADVSPNEWYYPYVATAAKLGITSGMGDGRFGVGEPVSRQDMAALLYRMAAAGYVELEDKVKEIEFTDYGEIDAYAREAVRAMQRAGVINGYEDGRFAPKDAATRDMAAKMIYNILVGGTE